MSGLQHRLAAEALGSAMLVAAIVGSGIMADRLSDDLAVTLLANALATGAILVVLIASLAPISGAHFNPVVSLIVAVRGELRPLDAVCYAIAQIAGAVVAVVIAHTMFGLPPFEPSNQVRSGAGLWLSEGVAAFGLILVILIGGKTARPMLPWLVGLFILSAYWFTASTSFANPAVTIARALTGTFTGIRPDDVLPFIASQLAGGILGLIVASFLLPGIGAAKPEEAVSGRP